MIMSFQYIRNISKKKDNLDHVYTLVRKLILVPVVANAFRYTATLI